MPSAPGGGPQMGQMVIYRASATVAYPAVSARFQRKAVRALVLRAVFVSADGFPVRT
jgi:hypothetical protein